LGHASHGSEPFGCRFGNLAAEVFIQKRARLGQTQ
jgi:hypothetical protein